MFGDLLRVQLDELLELGPILEESDPLNIVLVREVVGARQVGPALALVNGTSASNALASLAFWDLAMLIPIAFESMALMVRSMGLAPILGS